MNDRLSLINALRAAHGDTVTRQQILDFIASNGNFQFPHWLCNDQRWRVSRGTYRLPNEAPAATAAPKAFGCDDNISLIPEAIDGYIPFGNHDDLMAVIGSGKFVPVFITGLSGCGKTVTVEQVCHLLNREMIRANITKETNEDHLLGGFRLIDGQTVFSYGPVVEAMRRGAVLLLDEVDLGGDEMMCLQPVLEGRGVYLKQINEFIAPAPGFMVVATANTKGQGSESGKFVGTRVLNEAMLDRYALTFEQEYPAEKVETKILKNVLGGFGIEDEAFVSNLVAWAGAIRKTYAEGAIDEVISTRRMLHIANAYGIFKDRAKAVSKVLSRFNAETREAMLALYEKMDATVNGKRPESVASVTIPDDAVPF